MMPFQYIKADDIANKVTVGVGSVVVKDISQSSTFVGNPTRIFTQGESDSFSKAQWRT